MEAWKRYIRRDDSHLVDLFVGQLKSTLRCSDCNHESVTFEAFWDLSLGIPSKTGEVSLLDCLDTFTKEEVLDGDEMPVILFVFFLFLIITFVITHLECPMSGCRIMMSRAYKHV